MSISLSDQTTTPVKTLVQDQHLPLQKEPTLSTFWRHTLHCRFFLKVFSLKTWGSPFPPCTHTRKTHTDTGKRDSQSVSNLIQNQKWRCDPWSCLLSKTPCLNNFLTFTQELDLADVVPPHTLPSNWMETKILDFPKSCHRKIKVTACAC